QQDAAGLRRTARLVAALLDRERDRGIPAERLLLAGFSQGGAMALHVGLRYPHALAGILALSCYLPLADELASEGHPANRETPVLMLHGRSDDVVPARYGRDSCERLRALGYDCRWQDYPMRHEVCPEEIQVIGAWLRERLIPE
ncbi:MAG: hypothetical protein R3202_13050, partial [Candidatus Competibacterales bacterium]|nr:hypothetical protein [Candidatus Competibacterales bacterium]